MNINYLKTSERLWLALTIGAFLMAVYMIAKFGMEEWGYFIGFGLAGSMYIFRRFLRKRAERSQQS